jgi:hypothetical protein
MPCQMVDNQSSWPLNPSNAKLNPLYHFPALLSAHPILHISGVRVNPENSCKYAPPKVSNCLADTGPSLVF